MGVDISRWLVSRVWRLALDWRYRGRRFERARMSLVVMEAAVVSVGWE